MTLAFVPDDGYTESGYIAEVAGLCPEIRFEYRPTRQEEREHLTDRMRKLSPNTKAANKASYAFLAGKLKSWNLTDADGNEVLITDGIVSQLKPFVFDRLFLIVTGQAAPDQDPQAGEEAQRREAQIQKLMREKSVPYADAAAEVDQKNS